MLPWPPLPREESSENDILLDSSMLPSLLLVLNSRTENKQGGEGGTLLRMTALFQGEGRVIVKTSRDRNLRWGHGNQQMYYADGQGWSPEQVEWMRTDLGGLRRSLFPISVCQNL